MYDEVGPRMAAIVCSEVANGAAILLGVRDEPAKDVDSGWQFLCGGDEHVAGKVWAVHEVVDLDSSIGPFIDYPVGTVIRRESSQDNWRVSYEAHD